MKKYLLILLLLPFSLFAQDFPLDSITQRVVYKAVVPAEATKDQLYTRSRTWFAKTFQDADKVLTLEDKEAGQLIGKGFSPVAFRGETFRIWFSLVVECKDNKYRYTFENLELQTASNRQSLEVFYNRMLDKKGQIKPVAQPMIVAIQDRIKDLQASLKQALQAKSDF